MALKNINEYHKIEILDLELERIEISNPYTIIVEIYENSASREAFKTGNESKFDKKVRKIVRLSNTNICEILAKYSYNSNKNGVDNILTALYNYIKTLNEYSDFEDC